MQIACVHFEAVYKLFVVSKYNLPHVLTHNIILCYKIHSLNDVIYFIQRKKNHQRRKSVNKIYLFVMRNGQWFIHSFSHSSHRVGKRPKENSICTTRLSKVQSKIGLCVSMCISLHCVWCSWELSLRNSFYRNVSLNSCMIWYRLDHWFLQELCSYAHCTGFFWKTIFFLHFFW